MCYQTVDDVDIPEISIDLLLMLLAPTTQVCWETSIAFAICFYERKSDNLLHHEKQPVHNGIIKLLMILPYDIHEEFKRSANCIKSNEWNLHKNILSYDKNKFKCKGSKQHTAHFKNTNEICQVKAVNDEIIES